eukprot:CAMPEP_0183730484 /NCGR_PEP_ID=MMETSP0737-20130205/32983_1 /TAXON_ID=385413 /ORGANISM="Thalassiosira miniscula, Strain CCMP1093" /LENGTH=510 /DNA_ID=CAMNT_0025962999 /DNA_START=9 /DNA_END=1541 /DNA_ORIENTATION=+
MNNPVQDDDDDDHGRGSGYDDNGMSTKKHPLHHDPDNQKSSTSTKNTQPPDAAANNNGSHHHHDHDRPSSSSKKKQKCHHNDNNDDDGIPQENDGDNNNPNLDESTTVEDLSSMDVATYMAWVNRQANSLPNVFVAKEDDGKVKEDKLSETVATATVASRDSGEEEPIEGSQATLQIMLSKRMDILPPPTVRHLPPSSPSSLPNGKDDDASNGKGASLSSSSPSLTTEDTTITAKQQQKSNNEWITKTISNFSTLRTYLEKEHAKEKESRNNNNNNHPQQRRKVPVPKMKDRAAWHVFCLGREEAYGNLGGYEESGDEEEMEDEKEKKLEDDKEGGKDEGKEEKDSAENDNESKDPLTYHPTQIPPTGHEPTTSLLLQLDQVLTRRVFHHHVHYLCEWNFPLSKSRAAWMYALLARMEKPWHREECCAVRSVLRECCRRRWELKLPPPATNSADEEEVECSNGGAAWEQLALLNTLIAITGIYYEQGAVSGGDGIDALFTVVAKEKNSQK